MSAKIADRHAHGFKKQAQIVITIWDDGALSVEGPIEDKIFTLAVLENAKDAVRNHRSPQTFDIVIPSADISIEKSSG